MSVCLVPMTAILMLTVLTIKEGSLAHATQSLLEVALLAQVKHCSGIKGLISHCVKRLSSSQMSIGNNHYKLSFQEKLFSSQIKKRGEGNEYIFVSSQKNVMWSFKFY